MIIRENVTDYKYHLCTTDLTINTTSNETNDTNKSYYFVLDNSGSYALAHWIYEVFIFINTLRELNNKDIKILTTNDKKYVKSILHFFNIPNDVVYKINNYNNICYFPKIYSLNVSSPDDYYNNHLDMYIRYIKDNIISLQIEPYSLYLPRNDKDNFHYNDREINNKELIKDIVINNGGVVLDTYNLNNIRYQFTILNNSKTIILDYGSSLFFNCIFLENKQIYVLDDTGTKDYQTSHHPFYNFLYDKIASKNTITIIKTHSLDFINDITKSKDFINDITK